MNFADLLDRIIRANYIFLFWLTVVALISFAGLAFFFSPDESLLPRIPPWLLITR